MRGPILNLKVEVIAFIALVVIQVSIAVVYTTAQTSGKYEFSPASALVLSELMKVLMSCGFIYHTNKSFDLIKNFLKYDNFSFLFQSGALAFLYAANNHLAFIIFTKTDGGTINLFKSGTTFISAILLKIFFNREVTSLQWVAIMIQLCGLITAQYDSCAGRALIADLAIFFLCVQVIISCINGVWNERLLKNFDSITLHVQNFFLYMMGFIFNLMAFFIIPVFKDEPLPSFFHGYTASAWLVVFLNSVIGIAIVTTYKYADVLVKTFAMSFSTATLFFLNYLFFGWNPSVPSVFGALTVFAASYIYMTNPPPKAPPPPPVVETAGEGADSEKK